MPRGDGTGPSGLGPMTGRGAGYCAGYQVPGYMNPVGGRGFGGRGGWGRGGGHGWRHVYYATGVPGWARGGWVPGGAGGPYGPVGPGVAPGAVPGIPREQEVETLKAQADYFQGALEDIRKRLSELEGESE